MCAQAQTGHQNFMSLKAILTGFMLSCLQRFANFASVGLKTHEIGNAATALAQSVKLWIHPSCSLGSKPWSPIQG